MLQLDLINSLLFLVGISNFLLGVMVFTNDKKATINRLYSLNIFIIIGWILTFGLFRNDGPHVDLWLHVVYAVATFIPSTFVHFSILFPIETKRTFRREMLIGVYGANLVMFTITLFTSLVLVSAQKGIGTENPIVFGPLYVLYALYISGLFSLGLWNIYQKYQYLSDDTQQRQIIFLLIGYGIASTLAMITNLIMPWIGLYSLDWLGQVFTVCMIVPVTYAILRYRLFDTKVILTEVLIFLFVIGLTSRLMLSQNLNDFLINLAQLILSIFLGWLLIRATITEVSGRIRAENLSHELELANRQQESLLHFISHEIKGYFTKNEAAFAAITAGDFGPVSPQLSQMSTAALADVRTGVATVMNILDASNLQKGTVSFSKKSFDFKVAVQEVAQELRPEAEQKGLQMQIVLAPVGSCMIDGDEEKIRRHVIRNLIENAIHYTLSGSIRVELSQSDKIVRLVVQDSGIGITSEDMRRLFTEGGRGKDSLKVNVHSTGYGLFIAKQVVEVHRGNIWAESDGPGRGSRFIVQLPTA